MTFLIIIIMFFWAVAAPKSFFTILIITFVGSVIYLISKKQEEKNEQNEQSRIMEEERIAQEKLIKENNIPINSGTIKYKYGHPLIKKKYFNAYIWADNENLYFFDKDPTDNVGRIEIALKAIDYYDVKGDVHRETKISGGGITGGGSCVGGAITGGIIAGGAGAVIGSRKKVTGQPISSETITHDERETFLNVILNGERKSIFFNYKGYDILLDLIPDKSYKNIHTNYIINQSNDNQSKKITDQIKDLSNLRDEGILTEDEFQQKKTELLSKI